MYTEHLELLAGSSSTRNPQEHRFAAVASSVISDAVISLVILFVNFGRPDNPTFYPILSVGMNKRNKGRKVARRIDFHRRIWRQDKHLGGCFGSSGGDIEGSCNHLHFKIHSSISTNTYKSIRTVTAQLCPTRDIKVYGLVPVGCVNFTPYEIICGLT